MKFKLFVFIVLLFAFSALDFIGKSNLKRENTIGKEKMVIAVDTLVQNYFILKGEPTGYQLELIELYSENFNMSFELLPVADNNQRLALLQNGTVDVAVFSEGLDSLYQLIQKRSDICASIPLDDKLQSVWVVKNGNEDFICNVNLWISELRDTPIYKFWQIRFFDDSYMGQKGSISYYDHLFKKYSAEIDWDWRLLASLSYQESRFDPAVKSRKGAYGLMQVMPKTAAYLGVNNIEHPENNIKAGVKLISWLKKQFDKDNSISEEEKLKFLLSAYNAGIGRIEDCRNFALSQGKNPSIWDDVRVVVPLMEEREHYEGDYIQRGKFKGDETIRFVDEVLERYEHYKNLVPSS